jgi:hypothetical protein
VCWGASKDPDARRADSGRGDAPSRTQTNSVEYSRLQTAASLWGNGCEAVSGLAAQRERRRTRREEECGRGQGKGVWQGTLSRRSRGALPGQRRGRAGRESAGCSGVEMGVVDVGYEAAGR